MVFVFGSNEAGIHGAGAARFAKENHGAVLHQGWGHHGNSFAIPTKDRELYSLSLSRVKEYVKKFVAYATEHPELQFQVTQIGCGLAGFTPEEIAPLFQAAPDNCLFDDAWKHWLPEKKFWGTVTGN